MKNEMYLNSMRITNTNTQNQVCKL